MGSKQAPRTTESWLRTMRAIADGRSDSLSIMLTREFGCLLAAIDAIGAAISITGARKAKDLLEFINHFARPYRDFSHYETNSGIRPCGGIPWNTFAILVSTASASSIM